MESFCLNRRRLATVDCTDGAAPIKVTSSATSLKETTMRALQAFAFTAVLLSSLAPAEAQTPDHNCLVTTDEGAEAAASPPIVAQMIGEVQRALRIVKSKSQAESLPELKKVDIVLHTVLGKGVSGGLQFLIITIGGKVSDEEVQKMELTLSPPKADAAPEATPSKFAEALAQAILAAARDAKVALSGEPQLKLGKLVATMSFAVKKEGNVGGGLVFLPITLNFGLSLSKAQTHTAMLTFGE
jgi:hypothetical protein